MTSWLTLPASVVQGVHSLCACRLETRHAHVPALRLPNGLMRAEGVRIEAAFRLGGDFHFLARVLRSGERGTLLQVEAEAFDVRRHHRVPLKPSEALLAQVYAELTCRYLAAQGRAYGRGEGRN